MDDKMLDKILFKIVDMEEKVDTIAVNMATKEDLREVENRILGDVDRFVKLHETLDQELSALRSKYNRLEERLIAVEKKLQLA